MSHTVTISPKPITIDDLAYLLKDPAHIELSKSAQKKITHCRKYLDEKIAKEEGPIYGVNTGFGALCNVSVSQDQIEQLQANLLMSHACGMGDEVREEVVRLMIYLKIHGLALGHSGITLETTQRLVDMYNKSILPVVWQVGSLGASGDLAPLAHLSLPLIGMGEVRYNGRKYNMSQLLSRLGWEPITLKAKEGLALINGTQFMSAWGCWSLIEARRVCKLADLTAAISLDAFNCQIEPFDPKIQNIRAHEGQVETANNVREFLKDSDIAHAAKYNVQDPYSFRCVPQVHGATKGVVKHVAEIFEQEINSVTDNPLVFPDEDEILSGGNFHGQPLAMALDYLAIGMSELASISERRTFQLISGKRDLPSFLTPESGLNSGLMIPQYTAASIVNLNKLKSMPASVDTITSSDGQEDHVSMGANAAVKTYEVVYNIEKVLAIEFLTAMQALDFRKPRKTSTLIENIRKDYRKIVPFNDKDRVLYDDIQVTVDFMREIKF